MREIAPLKKRIHRLQSSLTSTIENFRKGNDCAGLDSFFISVDDMESLLEYQQYTGDIRIKLDEIEPVLQTLYNCIKNQDITGITDVLEFVIYPLTEEWIERCDE